MVVNKQKLIYRPSKIQPRGSVLPGLGGKCTVLNMNVFVQVFVALRAWANHIVSLHSRKMKLILDDLLGCFHGWKKCKLQSVWRFVLVESSHPILNEFFQICYN